VATVVTSFTTTASGAGPGPNTDQRLRAPVAGGASVARRYSTAFGSGGCS